MKAMDIRELTDDELREKRDDMRQELFNLRMQKSTSQLDNPARLKHVRRTIARVLTVTNDRKREGGVSS